MLNFRLGSVGVSQSYLTSQPPRFLPQLEGLRAVAALGVLATHAAFQSGIDQRTPAGAILARFDFFVAVFFALSAFLLARGNHKHYYRRRAQRILPAYWACCAIVFALLPNAFGTPWYTILATFTLTQIYLPHALAGGLTHLWSLSVEVAFYLLLPLLIRIPQRYKIPSYLGLALAGFGWAAIPWPTDVWGGVNFQLWPMSCLPWFVVGLCAAELEQHRWIIRHGWLWWLAGLAVAWLAGQQWYGPLGLIHPTPAEFIRKIAAGTVFAALIIAPCIWGAPRSLPNRILTTRPMLSVGRWSYSLFLWHLPVLTVLFEVTTLQVFSSNTGLVFLLCAAISIVVAWISYELVESVGRFSLRHRGNNAPIPNANTSEAQVLTSK
ncbi:acyltransferase family protein [Corynebacterium diphtheriae]|uniref:acyltransferase family protein n=1 Tax=Corynebacterium diphtheriae TaxID=1717 RepID=UPI0008FB28BA|nr:acyltransferase [Corynebacterium diphtheriae]MBG9252638.1 acyltransferase [Corynebacterium diphtheriae bv. mitis]UJL50204.1 acyltransferase [Corynebacterium diphtheriae]